MPSFDIVSEVEMHEVTNAVDQANREKGNRWDFKKVAAEVELKEQVIQLSAEQDFQLDQLEEILRMAFAKRKLDPRTLVSGDDSKSGKQVKRDFSIQQGVDQDTARKMVKMIKESKIKVQAAIQGEKVRVTGKKRDDLQDCIALIKSAELGQPFQFNNFRD